PLIDEDAVAKVEELVADAVERGARMVTGGERGAGGRDGDGGGNAAGGENAAAGSRDGAGGGNDAAGGGFFYSPTVLADVPRDARVNHEEIFGPVAPLVVLDEVEEMVSAAHDTEFGLMAYVAGEDLAESASDRKSRRLNS